MTAVLGKCARRAAVQRARVGERDALRILPECVAQQRALVRREHNHYRVAGSESVLKERDEPLEKRLIRRIDQRLMDETGLHGAHAFSSRRVTITEWVSRPVCLVLI